jgi:hypothetical protein
VSKPDTEICRWHIEEESLVFSGLQAHKLIVITSEGLSFPAQFISLFQFLVEWVGENWELSVI